MNKQFMLRMLKSGVALFSAGMICFASVAGAQELGDPGVEISADDPENVGLTGSQGGFAGSAYSEGELNSAGVVDQQDSIDDQGGIAGVGYYDDMWDKSDEVGTAGSNIAPEDAGGELDSMFQSDPVDPENDDDDVIIILDPEDDPGSPSNPVVNPVAPVPAPKASKPSYSISYVMNGGVNYGASPTTATYEETFNVSNPTRNGYVFEGWYISGLDSSIHYIDYGATSATSISDCYATAFSNLTATGGTVTFTAQWSIPAVITGVSGLVQDGSTYALVSEAGVPADADVDYLLNNNRVSFPTASAAGTYTIEYNVSAPGTINDVRGMLKVTIAKPAVKQNLSVSGFNGTYDGNDHGVKVTVSPKGTAVEYSTNNSSWSSSAPKFRDVTNSRVYVRLADNPSISASAEVVIKKKNANIYFSTNFPGSMNQNVTFSTDYKLDAGSQVTMTSSNPSVLNVNYSGSNVSLSPGSNTGTVTITVRTDETNNYTGIYQQYNISVVPSKLVGLAINPSAISIAVGTTAKISVTGTPAGAPINNLAYVSSDSSIVTVDANGNLSGKKAGKAVIGAYSGGVSAQALVEVYSLTVPTVAVALDRNSASIAKGDSFTLNPTVTVNDNTLSKALAWTTSDKSVATVSNGSVKGIKAGTADITARTVTGNTATCRVTVSEKVIPKVEAVTIDPTAKLSVGDTTQLSLNLYPEGISDKVTWTTTDNRIVIVNGGMIQGVSPGTAVVKAVASNGKYSSCAVTVFDINSMANEKAQQMVKASRNSDDGNTFDQSGRSAEAAVSETPVTGSTAGNEAIWKTDNAPAQEDLYVVNDQAKTAAQSAELQQATLKAEKKGMSMGLLVAALIGIGVAATAGIIAIGRRR
ncbi:MAG: Ig-like domain-containing protein [Lachnospiraceae bacterium]|nr:Ig-like domain-containing protein [Lachnospiraceae bacterium]